MLESTLREKHGFDAFLTITVTRFFLTPNKEIVINGD
jgi:hypothetical protein